MKRGTAFWVFWHAVLIISVAGGFYSYRHHILNQTTPTKNQPYDEGIPLVKLMPFIEEIAKQHPDCRIYSFHKEYNLMELKTDWIHEQYRSITYGLLGTDGEWSNLYEDDVLIDGIAPAELVTILNMAASTSDVLFDKRILLVTISDRKVEIKSGVTNHSLGGHGDIIVFEKVDGEWEQKEISSWMS